MRLPVSDKKLTELREETSSDRSMAKLSETIQNGWPKHKQSSPKDVREYWAVEDELSTADGLIFKGEAIVKPQVCVKKCYVRFTKDTSVRREAN